MQFEKIYRYTADWCSYDRLGDKNLKDGQILLLRWPNDKITEHTIVVDKGYRMESDHGHPCEIPTSHAYVWLYHEGLPIKVSVLGLEAQNI